MRIDLREDYTAVAEHLAARVREYAKGVNNKGPGKAGDPVGLITLGFQFDQAGWVALVLDTRPDAKSDGHWQFHIQENWVDFGHWFDAFEPMQEAEYSDGKAEPLTIILHHGEEKVLESYDVEEVAAYIGAMLWQVLMDAREAGLLAQLPLARKCLMGVEEHDGYYGWPHYKDRVRLGRVN